MTFTRRGAKKVREIEEKQLKERAAFDYAKVSGCLELHEVEDDAQPKLPQGAAVPSEILLEILGFLTRAEVDTPSRGLEALS